VWATKGKSGRSEETDRGNFWRGTAIDIDIKLRVGRAIGKGEEEVAMTMMSQIRDHINHINIPAMSSDRNDSCSKAMLETWGKLPEYSGGDDLLLANSHILARNVIK
jgi:hypothetical protein